MLVVLMACGETHTTGHTNGNGNNARGPVPNQAKTLTAEELEEVQIFRETSATFRICLSTFVTCRCSIRHVYLVLVLHVKYSLDYEALHVNYSLD
jgi:hypothetical protein